MLMKYAVVKTGGKQYRVSEGDVLSVEKLKNSKNGKVVLEDVLLVVSDGSVKIGKPYITGSKVEASIIENIKGDKVRVSKFKSKVRYRRVTGFRADYSKIRIEKIV